MATGLSTQLAKQVGEFLVAAELGRIGLVAATFAGSVPDYDIIATDLTGKSVPVQVKAKRGGGSWQFDIQKFASVKLKGRTQFVGSPLPERVPGLVCVMVALAEYGTDRFYVLPWTTLQQLLVSRYCDYLHRCGGVRPRKHSSFHTAINEPQLDSFKGRWLEEFRDRAGLQLT